METQSLFAFDTLARQAIDPVFDAVLAETQGNENYVFSASLGPASRTSCMLTITNSHVTKPHLSGSLGIAEVGDTVHVMGSFGWVDKGKSFLIATPSRDDVNKDKIGTLTRGFVADFFARVSGQT